jgi:DNA repair protein NreA
MCGRKHCAIYTKTMSWTKFKDSFEKPEFSGNAPSVFVGHYGYPNVNVGILATPSADEERSKEVWKLDAPRYWASSNTEIPQIVDYRSCLINSRFKSNIKSPSKMVDIGKEVSMASKPVDMEVGLKETPSFRLNVDPYSAPTGPNANLTRVEITSNPKIDRKVDKVVDDTDLLATGAMKYLYGKGFDERILTKLLSIGNIGIKNQRKLVPTRWSITAVDDNIGKDLIDDIKSNPETEFQAFFGGYLGNHYLVLTFPEIWSYELFEVYMPKTSWNQSDKFDYTTDYEEYAGRKTYAHNCAGGYYAARLPILEKLKSMKRQGSILAIRIITGDYTLPLGVWVCREATRKAMASPPISFGSKELMLKYAEAIIKKKFGYDASKILDNSLLLKNIKEQSKLKSFF